MLPDIDWLVTPAWLRKYGPLKLLAMPLLDRVGMHYYTAAALLGAILGGVFTLSGVVLRKTLAADEFQVALFTSLGPIALIIGIFGSELVQDRDKRPLIMWVGLLSRGVFLFFLFSRDIWSFIIIAALFFICNAFLTPAVYAMWQANISSEYRNRLWGLNAMITTVFSMGITYLSGIMLDRDPTSYRWMYALGGVIGILGIIVLARSPLRGLYKLTAERVTPSFERMVVQPIKTMSSLLSSDRRFLHFEAAFMLYGVAFMLLLPAMPLFIVDIAHMSYEQSGLATGVLGQLGMIFATMVWGRTMDRTGPALLCGVIFILLAFTPGVLLFYPLAGKIGIPLHYLVYLSYIIFGFGMSGVHVAWSLGPVTFAGERDASSYLGVHVTLTGIRGAIAPILGAIGLKNFGYEAVFATALACFLFGAVGMLHLHHKLKRCRATSSEATA